MGASVLEDVHVVDLSTGIAGPLATMFLADFGADVIKVEPPAGDSARALPGFAVWNRNKRGVIMDRGSPSDQRRLAQLLAGADVCVISDACPEPDPATISATYPHLIVLHMPPYMPTHTPWAGGGESHGLLTALAGTARRQSSFAGGPIDLVFPIALYVQGQWAAAATVAALIERQRSGFGQSITVAGMHGIMASCVGQLSIVPTQDPLPTNVGPGGRHPCYTTYQAKDGQWLFLAALIPKFQRNAFKVLGVGDIFADERVGGIPARMLLPENRTWIRQRLSEAFCTRPRDEWLELLEKGDCPAGPLCERDEWIDHPQIRANDLRVELDDPERGRVVMPGLPLVMTRSPGAIRTPAPELGQHDKTVIPWQPYPVASGTPPKHSRGPLAGYRVLDLGTILAGPYAGALLAELGADVVKVEPPVGDAFREAGFVYNRGQRGLAIDLTSSAAREAFYALVRTADVVLDNSRKGVPERLHVDYASLSGVNPDIITLSVTGFGEQGALAHKPGFDPVLQAMSGMMTAQGGPNDPALLTIPVNDIAAGTLAVFGICLGLFHRTRSRVGQRIWTSLLGCATMMQSGELVRFAGRTPAVRGGRDFVGSSALDRFYQVKDGWLRLQAPNVTVLQSAGLLGSCSSSSTDAERATALAQSLGSMTQAEALALLSAAGIPAAAARQSGELPSDPLLRDAEIFATLHMQDGTPFFVPHRYARFSRTEERAVFEAPGIGEHSREVLTEAGVGDSEIDALIETGVVKQGEPFRVVAMQNYR
jgi:crotonobetainyl-CoA:carnitine CoA-transferase CaiB-like acyl-CoA transferase